MHLLVIPWAGLANATGLGLQQKPVTPLYRLHCLHHMLVHVSPIMACEFSTVMPILRMRKLRFRAGGDWSRVPQLEIPAHPATP